MLQSLSLKTSSINQSAYQCFMTSRAEGTESLLKLIFLLGRRLVCLGRLAVGGGGLVEFLAEFKAGIIGQLSKEFVDSILGDLAGGGLHHGILVDVVAHGVFLILLLILLQGDESLI